MLAADAGLGIRLAGGSIQAFKGHARPTANESARDETLKERTANFYSTVPRPHHETIKVPKRAGCTRTPPLKEILPRVQSKAQDSNERSKRNVSHQLETVGQLSEIKLRRTDTTLDLSQLCVVIAGDLGMVRAQPTFGWPTELTDLKVTRPDKKRVQYAADARRMSAIFCRHGLHLPHHLNRQESQHQNILFCCVIAEPGCL
ncbi:hypothetical protein V8F20_011344 [Naviculisporaceae sp. PSN 640]